MIAFQSATELRRYLTGTEDFTNFRAVLGKGYDDPDIVIIKANPSWHDVKDNDPLGGMDGRTIRSYLLNKKIKYYATTVFPFVGNDKPKAKQFQATQGIIAEELRRIPCNKYLILGAEAARYTPIFQYPFAKHADIVGRNIEVDGNLFHVTYAPMVIANSPPHFKLFTESVDELLHGIKRNAPIAPRQEEYRVIEDKDEAIAILRGLPHRVAIDTETTGLDPYTCEILTIQISDREGRGYAFPWTLLPPFVWAQFLGPKQLVFQNGQFDVKVLANNGVSLKIHEDTMLMHSLIDETKGTHSLEQMAQRYLGVDKWTELVDYDNIADMDIETLGRYGARDTDLTLRLANQFRPQMDGRFVHSLLHRAQNSLVRCELKGIRIDRDKAHTFQEEIEKHLHDLQGYIEDKYELKNPNSPKQVLEKLLDMGVPLKKFKGKYSTNEESIAPHSEEYPIVKDILTYRHLTKAGSTYVRNILELSERDGRYHPEFKLANTETGRLAESLIMLIPRADDLVDPDLGKQYQVRLRELFIPDEGHVMIGADYSGLEVAMAAYITGDAQLIADIANGVDIHSVVAIQAFDLPIPLEPYATLKKRVTAEYEYQRTLAKRGTFTWLYGGAEDALMSGMGVTDKLIAIRVLKALRERYRGVANWQAGIIEQAKRTGSVTTPWGRTRRFVWDTSLDRRVLAEQEAEVINQPNQAMASDMNLLAFVELEEQGYNMLFPFHDATYLQEREDKAERTAKHVQEVMESIIRGAVPFRADCKIGPNWAAL